jgi:hypothetical protein
MSPWIQIQHRGEGCWTTAPVDQPKRGQGSQEIELEAKSRNHTVGHYIYTKREKLNIEWPNYYQLSVHNATNLYIQHVGGGSLVGFE